MTKNKEIKTVGTGLGSASAGVAYTSAVVVYLAFSLIMALIILIADIKSDTDLYLYLNYIVAPLAVIATQPVCAKLRNTGFKNLFPVKTKPKYYLVAILLAFGLLFSVSWINIGFSKLLENFGYTSSTTYLPDLTGGKVVLALFVIAVIPAVCEEGLFRGVILNNVEKEAGSLNTLLIVGFAFSLFHASVEQTVYQFICGYFLAFLAIRSRSILPSVLVHFLNNAVIIIMSACGMDTSGSLFDIAPLWVSIVVTVLSAVSFVAAAFILISDKTQLYSPQKGGVKKFFIYGSIGIAALAVLWVASLF